MKKSKSNVNKLATEVVSTTDNSIMHLQQMVKAPVGTPTKETRLSLWAVQEAIDVLQTLKLRIN